MKFLEVLGLKSSRPKSESQIRSFIVEQCEGIVRDKSIGQIASTLSDGYNKPLAQLIIDDLIDLGHFQILAGVQTVEDQAAAARIVSFSWTVRLSDLEYVAKGAPTPPKRVAFTREHLPQFIDKYTSATGIDGFSNKDTDIDELSEFLKRIALPSWSLCLATKAVIDVSLPFFRADIPQQTLKELAWIAEAIAITAGELYGMQLAQACLELAEKRGDKEAAEMRDTWVEKGGSDALRKLDRLQDYCSNQAVQITDCLRAGNFDAVSSVVIDLERRVAGVV